MARPTKPSISTRHNGRLFLLLSLVPQFQKDVQDTRLKFQIPEKGFSSLKEADQKSEALGLFTHYGWWGRKAPEPKEFQKAVTTLGKKYNLPYNFYSNSNFGVAWYILTNCISIPSSNWEIEYPLTNENASPEWVGIRAFKPLGKDEALEMIKELNNALSKQLPAQLSIPQRATDTLEIQFEMLEQIVKRTGKPIRKKKYVRGSYLDILSKNSPGKARKLERNHEHSILVEYDVPTLEQIAGKDADKIKQILARLNKTSKNTFGFGLYGK